MKWSLLELKKHQETPLLFSDTLELKSELMERDNQILDVAPIAVDGLLTVSSSEYLVHYSIRTVLAVPSSRSLEPVAFPMDLTVDEIFMTPEQYQHRSEAFPEEDVLILETQTLDLFESVMDNILLAIPLQVLSEEEQQATELPKGSDWVVLSEEEYLRQKEATEPKIDPRLAKLSELLDHPEDDEK